MTRSPLTRLIATCSLAGSLLLGGLAQAGSKGMVYIHTFTPAEMQKLMPDGKNPFGLHTETMKSGRVVLQAGAETRLEAELQGRLRDEAHHTATVSTLDKLAADPAAAQALFGTGYTIVRVNKPPRDVWDDHRDSPDGIFAGSGASLRIRTENGFSALNYKPPTRVDYANGMAHRIEAGINIEPFANGKPSAGQLALFADEAAPYNPMREFAKQYPGRNVGEIWDESVNMKQKRTMFEIQKDGVKHGEISVDAVSYRDPADHTKAGIFYRVEMEGEHLNANPTASQLANSGVAPHDGKDSLDSDNDKNPDLIELHRLNDILVAATDVKPAGMSKVAEARTRLGKPVAKPAFQIGALRPSLAK